MQSPASVDDVAARMSRELTLLERDSAAVFLDDAWAMVQIRRPSLVADLDAGTVPTQNATRVLAWMVVRVLKNPEGYDSETIDDWTGRRNALVASGALHVTDDELADLIPRRVKPSRSSIRLVVDGDA